MQYSFQYLQHKQQMKPQFEQIFNLIKQNSELIQISQNQKEIYYFLKIIKQEKKQDQFLDKILIITQYKNLTQECLQLLKSILKSANEEQIEKFINQINGQIDNIIFSLISQKLKLKYKHLIVDFLQNTFLQDKCNAKLQDWFAEIIDEVFYKENIHQSLIKLINRNFQNIELFDKILCLKIDFSEFFLQYFELLQEHILDEKLCDKSIEILGKCLQKCQHKSEPTLAIITNVITKTYNEKLKVKIIQLLQDFQTTKVTEYLLNHSISIQNDESIAIFQKVFQNMPIDEQCLGLIKKNISNNNAKCQAIMLMPLIINKKTELNDIIEKELIQNYFKNQQKIVSNSYGFLSALALVSGDKFSEQLLKPDLFINKSGFHLKAQKQELINYLQVLLSINYANLNTQKQVYLSVLIFQLIKQKQLSQSDLIFLKSENVNQLTQILFIQQFFPEIEDNKFFFIINYIINNFEKVEENNYFFLLYAIYGRKVTRNLQLKFQKSAQIQKLKSYIEKNQDDFLFSLMNKNCSQTFAKAFSDLKIDLFFDRLKPIFIFENYLFGQDEIQKIDVQYKSNSFFVDTVTLFNSELLENQFTSIILPFAKIEQKTDKVVVQKVTKKQTKPEIIKKDKIEFFDEEQLLKYQKQQSLDLGLEYLEKSVNLIKTLVENPENLQKFFLQYYPELIRLAQIKESTNSIYSILINLFLAYKETRGHAFTLTEIIIKMHSGEPQQEDNVNNLVKLLIKLQTVKSSVFITLYKQLCCYILNNKNYESRIKKEILLTIFNLLSIQNDSQKQIQECYQIFVNNVNTLGGFQHSEQLFTFLVKNVEKNQIKLIFQDLLNLNDKAQNLFMKSLMLKEVVEFPKNFEIYITLKIIIEQGSELGSQVFDKIQFSPQTIEKTSILEFDLYRFITNNSKESQELLIQIIKQQFTETDLQDILIQKCLNLVEPLFRFEQPEETILFFPQFLNHAIIDPKFYEQIIATIMKYCCCEDHPNLFQLCLEFCLNLIKQQGSKHYQALLLIYDPYLEQKLEVQQQIFVLVCMGVLAPFIQNKSKVDQLGTKILNLLKIPNQNIQKCISKCLPDLFIFFQNPKNLLEETLKSVLIEKNQDLQRGQAYLISGLIKGLGIRTIEEIKINSIFENFDKKDNINKQGTLWIIYALIENLQKIFEPFFLSYFDQLIQYFSESNEGIRNLAIQTARMGMSNISAYGVSLLLPILLKSLDQNPTWRAKIANLWALGNMAYCSPKTLSSCLPQIVPILSNSLTDTHPKIREAAHQALTLIGSTIRNPELTLIVDVLIKSISDPFYENKKGLNILLKTEFAHFIDVPALSLIVPIIEYALTSRDQDSKELASKIVATLTYLIKDAKDILPYLNMLINALKETICDHLTEVRTLASKAFGSLAKKLNLQYSDPLKDCLIKILNSDTSTSVERAGAAQALCEVIYNIGMSQFESMLPFILKNTQSESKQIKEGYIGLFIYFPQIMEEQFSQYISISLEHILISISDENESLRNLSLRVIKIFIQKYGKDKIDLLLIPVLDGVFSVNYLKRASCGLLLDDILKSVNLKTSEIYQKAIVYLYILRNDFVDSTKMAATNTWKANIENTPKTIKQILPLFIQSLCILRSDNLQDINYILKECIAEFMEKYQEQCLLNIFLIIEKFVKENEEKRTASFQILTEIISNSERQYILKLENQIVELLKIYMLSQSEVQRQALFQVFTVLISKTKNTNCLNQIVTPLLEEETDQVMGLKILTELLSSECQIIIDFVSPKLFTDLTSFKIDVIMNNASTIGPIIYQNQLPLIFEELFDEDFEFKDQLQYCVNILSVNIEEDDVQNFFIEILEHFQQSHQNQMIDILSYFLKNTSLSFLEYFIDIFQEIVPLIATRDELLAEKVNNIIEIVLNLDETGDYLSLLITCLNEIDTEFFAFNVVNGLKPYANCLQKSLNAREEIFDNALDLMNILINNCEESSFGSYASKFIGQLIRTLNYKKDQYQKQKVIDLISYFWDFPECQVFAQPIIFSYVKLLGEKITQINKQVVQNLIEVMDKTENQNQIIQIILNIVKKTNNQNYFYCIYEIVKQKNSWFAQSQKQLIELYDNILDQDFLYNSKIILGKTLGLLMKNNQIVIDVIENLESKIQGDEVQIQNSIYTYLLVLLGVIRKSQELGTLKKANLQIISYIGKISNIQRKVKIVLGLRKILNRPELQFLGVSQQTLKTVCDQEDEIDDIENQDIEDEDIEDDIQ